MPCSARHSASKASDMQELSVVMSGFDPYEDVTANPALIVPDTLAEQGMGGAMDSDDDLKDVAITADADNKVPSHHVINAAGPAAYWTGLPLNAILGAFAADEIPASLSSNAGTFVCNALFYKLQDWASRQGRTLSGFVNLPPVDEREHSQHGLTLDQQIRAGRDVIRETARYYVKPIGVNTLIA